MDTVYTAKIICEKRKEKGLTQKEIAESLNISVSAVSKWERGLNFPDLYLMEPLGDILGISVVTLLGLEDETTDTVIRNITEISETEKEASNRSFIRKTALFSVIAIIFVAVFFIMIFVVRSGGFIDSLNIQKNGMSMSIFAVVFGMISWGLGITAVIKKKSKEKTALLSSLSLFFCCIALYIPILIYDISIRAGDVSAVTDTAAVFNFGALMLLFCTILLNIIAHKS